MMAGQSRRQHAIVVRAARAAELAAVHEIVTRAYAEFQTRLTPPNWTTMMSNIAKVVQPEAAGHLLVAMLGAQVAGTVTYLPPGPKDYRRVPQEWAVIRVLAVEPALRGHGIARALTAECLRRAGEDGATDVGLHTAEMMHAARALYEDVGFAHHQDFRHLDLPFSIYRLRL